MQIGQSLAVDIFFEARNADAVEIGKAKNMRGNRAVRIDPFVLGKKADARQAEPVDFLLLFRRDRALDPNEALAGAEPLAQFPRVDIGKHGGQKFDRFVLVDDAPRFRENRHDLDVGCQDLAVAIENIGACRGDGIGGRAFDALRAAPGAVRNRTSFAAMIP